MSLAVAEERSFTRAAAKLGISQSALSHTMRRLEAKLGLRLLTRTTRSVAPTEAGERLIETLRPAFNEIDDKLASLTELRERPAGTVRITSSAHAARAALWPVIDRLTAENPDINVEISIDSGLVDIVSGKYDAGVRLGERLEQDMIAMPISPRLRMAAFAAPSYLKQHGTPHTPYDLANHNCIGLRMATSGGLYAWEFERDGKELKVKTEGQLVFNDPDLIIAAALAGRGIAFTIEGHVTRHFADGSLVRVLDDWCEPFDGYYLYYPSRRQPSTAFRLMLDVLRYRTAEK
ncbi:MULTISPECIES: LysR family transcriptional regulator [unclassified Sphingomonas]|uniref:LysR family transcriptional regulator n=1 Tax=unclassified Sphingomonas TaxID=196159 RepID=UPI0006F6CD38|nr:MULTISPECIES: LysR family transcriptional regulator [unclassified Sphingomonas]KQM62663.1 LysR family transcriptional regulator [Sphingomonas sp. Leaf16]KQN14914.1 LysR family transcriptional regulator [Sphingomonas sp. Leaf29]KQN20446.1 LysR family transcriptional regulator [Sphingomonas sp. Leaf32]